MEKIKDKMFEDADLLACSLALLLGDLLALLPLDLLAVFLLVRHLGQDITTNQYHQNNNQHLLVKRITL